MASLRLSVRQLCNFCSIKSSKLLNSSVFNSVSVKGEKNSSHNFISKRTFAYEAEGKTVAFITNKKTSDVYCFSTVMTEGFRMMNGVDLIGPVIAFPHMVFSWHINSAKDISEESLTLFKLIEPKIDILILGYGTRYDYTIDIKQRYPKLCKKMGIRFEALPTEQACGIFNFLALEHRYVAGAFIPPRNIDPLRLNRKKPLVTEDLIEDSEDEQLQLPSGDDIKKLK